MMLPDDHYTTYQTTVTLVIHTLWFVAAMAYLGAVIHFGPGFGAWLDADLCREIAIK